jgi:hypothetical protein
MDQIIRTIVFGTAVALTAIGAAKAGAPLGLGGPFPCTPRPQ